MATNEILPFAIGVGSNVESQANYAAETYVATGFVSGIAPSAGMNKLFRQTSLISAMVAQWMADNQANNIVDTATVATLESYFASSLRNKTIVTVTPTVDADVTISQAAADADIIILATGAWLSGHNVIVPNNTRSWSFFSSNAYDATVKTAAGTGYVVLAGSSRQLLCDSINVLDPIKASHALGYEQTWQDVTASRAGSTTYYNTTGRSIAVLVNGDSTTGPIIMAVGITVNGLTVGASGSQYAPTAGYSGTALAIVPPNGSYSATFTNCSKNIWRELR